MSHALVDIGILTRTTSENHYLDRLMTSLHTVSAGMPADILVESGEQLTKVEKRIRLFRRSQARYLCLHGDTKVSTPAGEIPIKDLVNMKDMWAYTLSNVGDQRKLALKPIRAARKTREDAEMVRVRFKWRTMASPSGMAYGDVVCTPDHKFLLLSGAYQEAQDLRSGDRLEPFYRFECNAGSTGWHVRLFNDQERHKESRFVFEQIHGEKLTSEDIVHHVNHDPFQNWPPTNLVKMTDEEHCCYHRFVDALNPDRSKKLSESLRKFYAVHKKTWQGDINRKTWKTMSSEEQQGKLSRMYDGLRAAKHDGRLSARSFAGWETRRKNGNHIQSVALRSKRSEIIRQQYADGSRISPMRSEGVRQKALETRRQNRINPIEMAVGNHEVIAVEPADRADVYCLEIPDTHNFVANGVFVHNCILEDDTEVLHDGWLVNLICRMSTFPNTAILNPAETRHPVEEVPEEALNDLTQEVSYCCGFCMVIDRESGIEPDVRVQTLDDLWLSLAARKAGWRCARTEATIVRHTKAPWGSDDAQPADQPDKNRWGADSDYYDSDKHHRKRIHEARLMIQTFGDLARMTLPKELVTHITDPLCDLPDPKVRLQSGIWAEEEIKIGGTI